MEKNKATLWLVPLFAAFLFSCTSENETKADKIIPAAGENWADYLGHPSSNQYSSLAQITKDNVDQLEIAWTYSTGDSAMYQSNNLVVDGMLFTATPERLVTALDARNGKHLWTFDPQVIENKKTRGQQRGVMYWAKDGDKRVITVYGSHLIVLDAETGKLKESFGDGGYIHLGEQMDLEDRYEDIGDRPAVGLNTPGYIFKDMIIIGAVVRESIPGAIRAFDIHTGERKWIFHTLPRPGEPGSETWPEGYLSKTGGASDWSGIAIDTTRGIVYSSTETAGPDFYGVDRYGENLYANSIVALDANTGKRIWHKQLVHHDLWDMDLPQSPTLLTVKQNGKDIDVVAQGTKMGYLFVFNRETGEPIWPIEERPTSPSEIEGIKTWPTQPFPTKPEPLTRQRYTEEDYSTISPRANQLSKDVLSKTPSHGSFPPPSLDPSIIFPGFDGGMEWGGAAADPNGILYVNVNEIPWFYQLVETKGKDGEAISAGERFYRVHCASCHGVDLKGDAGGGFPSLENLAEKGKLETAALMIENGGGRMPSFKRLREGQKKAILDFLAGDSEKTALDESAASADDPEFVFRGFHRFYDDEGYPAIKPPWGSLAAVDLNSGEIKWKVPLGEYPELTERGIEKTGTENYGGPIVTAGGLIFIGASADGKFRAFDRESGETLWEIDIPFDANSTPSTYMAGGKQYVVVSAGGAKMYRPKGGLVIAFALPD